MSRYFALTIQQTGSKLSVKKYNKALDRYEKALGIIIFPRYYEYGDINPRLHVHALITQSLDSAPLTRDQMYFELQKNHRKNFDFQPAYNKGGWLRYASKNTPSNGPVKCTKYKKRL